MIEAIDLTKRYADGTLALDALNLAVPAGEIYCLLGAIGAGKTTAIDLFVGFVRPTSGRARIAGIDVQRRPREARRRLAYLMGGAALHGNLTALQNLDLFARLAGRAAGDEECAMALREVGLPERAFGQRVRSFDPGARQKLALAAAMIKRAPALLLDEPLAGLDPQAAAEMVETLQMLRDRGRAILLATYDLFHAKQLADTVGILKEGRKVLSCSRDELRYQDLEALYLDYMRGGLEGGRRTAS
ncbi:MAG: ABC transporter ATP-binding protein [Acidobacteria bacterium]|nr:MAG: ABC transporter ATP-binding protein [Acidobacteriota bacterium]